MKIPALLVASLLMSSTVALAGSNEFPNGKALFFRPGDESSVVFSVSFGLLLSDDGGASFSWTCHPGGGGLDPRYAISPTGTLFAASGFGLFVSRDGGCHWEKPEQLGPTAAPTAPASIRSRASAAS